MLDRGPGISGADADQLFSLYYRAPSATTVPGAGVGLFVCRGAGSKTVADRDLSQLGFLRHLTAI